MAGRRVKALKFRRRYVRRMLFYRCVKVPSSQSFVAVQAQYVSVSRAVVTRRCRCRCHTAAAAALAARRTKRCPSSPATVCRDARQVAIAWFLGSSEKRSFPRMCCRRTALAAQAADAEKKENEKAKTLKGLKARM